MRPRRVGAGGPAVLRLSQESSPKPSLVFTPQVLVSTLGTADIFSGLKKKKAACFFAEKVGGVATAACSPPSCRGVVVAGRWRGAAVPLLTPCVQLWSPSPRGRGRNWEGVASVEMEVAKGSWELQQGWEGCAEGRGTGKQRGSAWPGGQLHPWRGSGLSPGQGQPAPELLSCAFQSCFSLVCPCGTWCCSLPTVTEQGAPPLCPRTLSPSPNEPGAVAGCRPTANRRDPPRPQRGGQQLPPTPCKGKETLSPE